MQASKKKAPKPLLIFAHRGEASAFIEELRFKALQGLSSQIQAYESDEAFLLISGEGTQNALFSTTAFLAHQKPAFIKEVVQMGVAGSLDRSLSVGSIMPIRCAYAEKRDGEPEFKSFPLSATQKGSDCISAVDRVFSSTHSRKLSAFASLVDRELWSIAYSSSSFDLPLKSYKYVTDYADEKTQCFEIGSKAKEISYSLLRAWINEKNRPNQTKSPKEHTSKTNEILESLKHEGFYWTTSQTQRFKSLMEKYQAKTRVTQHELYDSLPIQDIKSLEKHPKKRSQGLLNYLNTRVFPQKTRVKKILGDAVDPYQSQRLRIEFDPELERKSLNVHFQVESKEEALRHLETLQNLPFERIKKIFDGEPLDDESAS